MSRTEDRQVSVLFVGNFLHAPNVEAAEFLVKQIAPRFPDVRFSDCGIACTAGSRRLDRTSSIRATFRRLGRCTTSPKTIVVAPLFSGTGQRVKLLEAFAMACPVVTTRVGAMGFPIQSGEQAFLAETADEFETCPATADCGAGVEAGALGETRGA